MVTRVDKLCSFYHVISICCLLVVCDCIGQRKGEGPVIINETFEGSLFFQNIYALETGKWPYAVKQTDSLAFRGKKSVRFEIRENQPLVKNGKRAEAVIIKNLPSREMWYSFAVLFPAQGFEPDNQREVINQWYQSGTPSASLRIKDDTLLLEYGSSPETRLRESIANITKNEWHQVVVHFVHSAFNDGLVEVWYDGEKKISKHGGNMYDTSLPKWKIGLYKASFKHGTSDVSRRIIFFDNIRVGDKRATYEMMRPDR